MELNYSKESLDKLGIYELRNLAREVGVYSPTTLKKSEIIDKVLAIISGEDEPYKRVNKQGRPAKAISGMEDIYKMFKPVLDPIEFPKNEKLFSNVVFKDSQNFEPKDYREVKGYVKVQPDNCGLLLERGYFTDNFEENYFITDNIIQKFGLKDGDYILAHASSVKNGVPLLITDVKMINGLDVFDSSRRKPFEELENLYPFKKLPIQSGKSMIDNYKMLEYICPLGYGTRAIVHYSPFYDVEDDFIQISRKLSLNISHTMVIALGASPEYLFELKSNLDEAELIYCRSDRQLDLVIEELFIKLLHYKRLVEAQNDVAIVITDLPAFKSELKKYYLSNRQNDMQDVDSLVEKKMTELFNLAKATKNNGSLSLIAFSNEKDISDYMPLFNAVIELNDTYYRNTKVNINPFNSHIKKLEKILTPSQLILRERFLDKLDDSNFRDKYMSIYAKK